MKYMNKISKIKAIGLVALLGGTTVSCDLDLLPLNEVVLENYWKEEADVQSVLNACYVGMTEGSFVENIITWGELRSDNVTGSGTNDFPENLNQMMKGNILDTNPVCNWNAPYNVINRCNTLIHYAPQVADIDPNYTRQELNQSLAEAKTIRALAYFYLIRTFKDVPFTFEPSIDDFQDYKLPASKHEDVLNALIADIDNDEVIISAPLMADTQLKSTALITRPAVWTLLADMYLWKASNKNLPQAEQQEAYRKCVAYCDKVLNFKEQQLKRPEYQNRYESMIDIAVKTTYGYQLLKGDKGLAAEMIFDTNTGGGNSIESIFELTYSMGENVVHNDGVCYMYGGPSDDKGKTIRKIKANKQLMLEKPTDKFNYTDLFPVYKDYRSLTSFCYADDVDGEILKYVSMVYGSINENKSSIEDKWENLENAVLPIRKTQSASNWIVYRLTEVMLMRAEAEINLAYLADPAATFATGPIETKRKNGLDLSIAEEYYQDAFNLISAVYLRSTPNATADQRPAFGVTASTDSYEGMMNLLEKERQREFLFEAKRYYDLVRRARREGNNDHFANVLANKFGEASQAVIIKMGMPDFMYMPYSATQLDVNPNLKQNPAYVKSDDVVKN